MTCIIGAVDPDTGDAYLAGDSRWSDESGANGRIRKYIRRNGWILAGAGGIRLIQVVANCGVLPKAIRSESDVFEFCEIIKAVIAANEQKPGEDTPPTHFLLAIPGHIYAIDPDFTYTHGKVENTGSAGPIAHGAFLGMSKCSKPRGIRERLKESVRIAFDLNVSCGPPVWCYRVKNT